MSISLSVCDFNLILNELLFTNDIHRLILCIKSEANELYIKLIFEEVNISTYYINDNIMIDCTDILIMFEYKMIHDIISQTRSGTVMFELESNKITMKIKSDVNIEKTFYNSINEDYLGKLDILENNIELDSKQLYKSIGYFITSKNLSSYSHFNFAYLDIDDNQVSLKKDSLVVNFKTKNDFKINSFKIPLDAMYTFLYNKSSLMKIYISQDFPVICRCESNYGCIELYSTPINSL